MFMLGTADKPTGGIAEMPRKPRRSAAVSCAERPKRRLVVIRVRQCSGHVQVRTSEAKDH